MPANEGIRFAINRGKRSSSISRFILFFVGFALIVISMVDIPNYGVKPEIKERLIYPSYNSSH